MIEKWAYFFKHAEDTHEKDLAKIVGNDEVIERAYEELNRFSYSEEEMNTYESEEKRLRDSQSILNYQFSAGEDKGIAKGKAEERMTVAKKMLSAGADIAFIMQCTGLSEAEIKHLSRS